ncbi:MAG: heparinase II/III family protein [Ruthenibacterium sp.]
MWTNIELAAALAVRTNLLLPEIETFHAAPPTAFAAAQTALVTARGNALLDVPISNLSYADFVLYWKTGDRQTYQVPYYARRERLLVFALLCFLQPENKRYADALNEIVWAICAEPFWALPAHFLTETGADLPFCEFATQLDLFACETGFAMAEVLTLVPNALEPMVREQARLQVERRIFAPFLRSDITFRFENMTNNWSGVCASAIGGAALHLLESGTALTAILTRCLACENVYLSSFGDDGVCTEGVDYWTYGFGFFTCFADLLAKRTEGKCDLLALPKAQAIARSQQAFYCSGKSTVSFADGGETSHFRLGLSSYLQRRIENVTLPDEVLAAPLLEDTCYRFCLGIRDMLWAQPEASFGACAETAAWLPDAQWFLSRHDAISLIAKAGNNGESHNHNDCGSFIFMQNGVPLLCDLGAGLYDAAYFGPARYDIFVNRSGSHNVPILNGHEQAAGASFAAEDVKTSFTAQENTLTCELAHCYDCPSLRFFKRTLCHNFASVNVTLTDDIHFETPAKITEVFCAHAPFVLGDGCAVVTYKTQACVLSFDASLFDASVHAQAYIDHHANPQTAFLLHLTGKTAACDHLAAITLTPKRSTL